MTYENHFDVVIIGSGQAAYPLAKDLADHGQKIAVIEKEKLGGSCVNYGCTPTKTLVASARVAYLVRRGSDYGIHTKEITINMKEVKKRKQDIVDLWRAGVESAYANNPNITIFYGVGSFVTPKTVKITKDDKSSLIISAELIFINTGTRAIIPQIKGLDKVPFMDNKSILDLEALPDHLIIIGGGYIGLEFGQMYHRFGSRVTIIQSADQLATREDRDISEEIKNILAEDGITVLVKSNVFEIATKNDNSIQVSVETSKGNENIRGTHLLIAVGRKPNSDELNLSAIGVETDKNGWIKVNEYLETSIPDIYALGDVKGGAAFTHISYDDYRIVRDRLLNNEKRSITGRQIPSTVFIDPQLGKIGLNEKEAKAKGLKYRVFKMPMKRIARAYETSEPRGMIKVIVDSNTDLLLGATVLGIEGGEIMTMLQIAMLGNVTASTLREGIFVHPGLAEGFNNLFTLFEQKVLAQLLFRMKNLNDYILYS